MQFLAVKSLCENQQCFIWHRNNLKYRMQDILYFCANVQTRKTKRIFTHYCVIEYLLEDFLTSEIGFPATSFIKSGFCGEILFGISFETLCFASFDILFVSSAFFGCFLCSYFFSSLGTSFGFLSTSV